MYVYKKSYKNSCEKQSVFLKNSGKSKRVTSIFLNTVGHFNNLLALFRAFTDVLQEASFITNLRMKVI